VRLAGLKTLSSCLLAAAVGGCRSAGPAMTTALVDVEHQWVRAIETHDKEALDRLLAEDFIDSTFNGEIRTKPEVLSGPSAGGHYHSVRLEDLTVRSFGRTAIVTGINVLRGVAPHDTVRIRFTDVFIKEQGRWRAVSAQETVQAAD
jgi:ketosteroid isomerase-like protein